MAVSGDRAITGSDEQPRSGKEKKKFLAAFRMENHGGFAVYSWHGMTAGAWYKLLKKNNFRISAVCLPQVVTVSLFSPVNSLLGLISEWRYRRAVAAAEHPKAPVFIVGHWRSGTTYLHDLLACDSEFGYPTTYECLMPNHFLLTESLSRLWFGLFLPKTRPPDNVAVGFDKPQEDEFALCNMGLPSPMLSMAVPRQGPVDLEYLDLRSLSPDRKQAWIDGFLWFIRRVAYRQKKRLVLKSPTHTARLRTLIELFPDARFIYISRNPFSVFPSTVHLWKTMNSTQGLQNPANDDPWLEDYVLDTFMHMFNCYQEDRELIPEGQIAEIRYEELVGDPKGTLRRLYEELDLGEFERTLPAVEDYLKETRGYRTNDYALTGEQHRRVSERWRPYFERFGYSTTQAKRAAA